MSVPVPYLYECLIPDFETGTLIWKKRPEGHFPLGHANRWNERYAGTKAGAYDGRGYLRISLFVNGKRHSIRCHRVIYAMYYQEYPDHIDHINGVKDDNRIVNLRSVSVSDNAKNTKIPSHNTSGVIGVSWSKWHKKWVANINHEGKQKRVGYFDRKEDAIIARRVAEIQYGFHPNHGSR